MLAGIPTGLGMGCEGNPHVEVCFLWILGNPLNERPASLIGQLFALLSQKRIQFQHKALGYSQLTFGG